MPKRFIEALKIANSVTQPIALIAFIAVILLGCVWLVVQAILMLTNKRTTLTARHTFLIIKQLISSFFWLSFSVVVLGLGLDASVRIYKQSLDPTLGNYSRPLPDAEMGTVKEPLQVYLVNLVNDATKLPLPTATPTSTPAATPNVTPTATPNVTPTATPTPIPRAHEYKLVWYDHYQPDKLWEVKKDKVNLSLDNVRNELFHDWCVPFYEKDYIVYSRRLIAGDEEFKVPQDSWLRLSNSLPPLKKRWLEIMDDEKWYLYEVAKP